MDAAAYLDQMKALLPPGAAWPRQAGAALVRLLGALSMEFARVDGRLRDLVEEADPRTTFEALPEWERVAGLPDPCVPVDQTLQERRERLVQRLTGTGGQSRAFFLGLASSLGYAITLEEFRPFVCGRNRCGDVLGGPETVRHVWRVRVPDARVVLFRAGASRAGERLGTIRRAEDLECLFQRLKPAHTVLIFAYEGA